MARYLVTRSTQDDSFLFKFELDDYDKFEFRGLYQLRITCKNPKDIFAAYGKEEVALANLEQIANEEGTKIYPNLTFVELKENYVNERDINVLASFSKPIIDV